MDDNVSCDVMQVLKDESSCECVEELAAHGVCDRGWKHGSEFQRSQLLI